MRSQCITAPERSWQCEYGHDIAIAVMTLRLRSNQYITARNGVGLGGASPCGKAEISGSGVEPHMHTA